jgi:hypothetical protein
MARCVRTTLAVNPGQLAALGTDELLTMTPGLHALTVKIIQVLVVAFEVTAGAANHGVHLQLL